MGGLAATYVSESNEKLQPVFEEEDKSLDYINDDSDSSQRNSIKGMTRPRSALV